MVTITTAITQLTDEGPVYRGRRATDLATSWRYEQVAEWLWDTGRTGPVAGPAVATDGAPDLGLAPPASAGPRAVRPDPVGGGDGRRPRSAPCRSPARGGGPHGQAADGVDGRRAGGGRRGSRPGRPGSGRSGDGADLAGSMAERLASALSADPTRPAWSGRSTPPWC